MLGGGNGPKHCLLCCGLSRQRDMHCRLGCLAPKGWRRPPSSGSGSQAPVSQPDPLCPASTVLGPAFLRASYSANADGSGWLPSSPYTPFRVLVVPFQCSLTGSARKGADADGAGCCAAVRVAIGGPTLRAPLHPSRGMDSCCSADGVRDCSIVQCLCPKGQLVWELGIGRTLSPRYWTRVLASRAAKRTGVLEAVVSQVGRC
jgi:hypothetical protein